MSRKPQARSGNPDLRRATQLPSPPIAEIEARAVALADSFLVQHHKMLGLIQQERKRHRENAALDREIWESTA